LYTFTRRPKWQKQAFPTPYKIYILDQDL